MKLWLMFLAALALPACSSGAERKAAEQGLASFHKELNAARFQSLYDGSDSQLKAAATSKDFVSLLSAVHRKLGAYKSGKTVGWNVNYTSGGTFVTLNHEAQFERGPGQETFVFQVTREKPSLVGYHINSNQLVTG